MKLFIFALLTIAPASTFAASVWETSTEVATEAYRLDFKAERGQEASAPVGFSLLRGDEETITQVYFLDSGILRSFTYGCHLHDSQFDCHREDRGEHGTFVRPTSKYDAAEMAKAIEASLDIFVRKVAPESAIKSIKIWEAEEMIRFSIAYEKSGSKQEFLACHYHTGTEMDCHRKGNSGPGEPNKK